MLVLTRKVGEAVIVGDNVRITVTAVEGGRVRIGIDAPPHVPVLRSERCLEPTVVVASPRDERTA